MKKLRTKNIKFINYIYYIKRFLATKKKNKKK